MNKMSEKIIGICIADKEEYAPLEAFVSEHSGKTYSGAGRPMLETSLEGVSVRAICAGIGKVNAAVGAMELISSGCNIIFNIGYAGGISGVRRGEILVGEKFLEHDFDLTSIGYGFAEKPAQEYIYSADAKLTKALCGSLHTNSGTVVTGDRFINDSVLRENLKENFGANACDMEAAAVAYAAASKGVPFCSVKIISDDAGNDALDSYREMNEGAGASLLEVMINCLKIIAAEV